MAHLRSVRLRGFKTFARPTELTFEAGVTVIIGPNGSGKSNIADAVLWVLGEQSPASLRGRNMQDVIFSGPDGRRSSAVAEVSLVFDNAGRSLPLDADEVELTRRLERDGGSEYRLNGSACRLLDVQDLVGSLGLGREMHSVISQGKVEALLNSTPEARRALVEEAAGLGRFKKRRARAQAKLERTRQNLLRVADIEREVKAALRPLRQQAAAAERFAEAKEEWASAKAKAVLAALLAAQASCETATSELRGLETRRSELEARLAGLRRERAAEEEGFSSALQERERIVGLFHRATTAAEHMEGRVAALRQRLARSEGEESRARRRWELSRTEAASLDIRLTAALQGTADEARLDRVAGWNATLRDSLDEVLPVYRAAAAEEDDLKDAVFELEAARSRAAQDREFLRRELESRQRVGTELAALAREAAARRARLEEEAADLDRRIESAQQTVLQAQAALRAAAAAREEARIRSGDHSQAEASLAEELAGVEARRGVLTDLIRRREGLPAGARELLRRHEGCLALAEALDVEPGYERAVAAALGPVAQAVVLEGEQAGTLALQGEEPVEVVLGESDPASEEAPPPPPTGTRDLWEVVDGPASVLAALRKVLPATALVVGRERLDARDLQLSRGPYRLVSRAGEVAHGGVYVARRREMGAEVLLESRNELQVVAAALADLGARRENARAAGAAAAAEMKEAEAGARAAEEGLRGAERILAAHGNERDLVARRLEEAADQVSELEERRQRESGLAAQMAADLRGLEEAMSRRDSELEETRAALRAVQARLEGMRVTVARLEEKKSQAALLEVRLRERCRAQEGERLRVTAQRDAALAEAARWQGRATFRARYVPALEALLAVAEGLAEQARSVRAVLETEVEQARQGIEESGRALRDRGGLEAGLQQELDGTAALLTQLQVEAVRQDDRRRALEEELAELRRRHTSPRLLEPGQVVAEDPALLEAAVARAERRLERIGPVNPLAEAECAEMEERAGFLAEQRRDLEASVGQLQDVIAQLDEHIERAFAEMFGAVKEHFASVIATVFPGARGSLSLVESKTASPRTGEGMEAEADEARPEEAGEPVSGIGLEVKLPNKSPRSLSLLSGGEKAMAAIAFLFSLFLARPCPFYILDEVEASLDDINIRRFLSLIRRYRERTQFIIITHQRQTMEVADTLYGVTLESDGTSRVLSRRLATAKGA